MAVLGPGIGVEVELVASIPQEASGKRPTVKKLG
jgi:hypothetical protein